MTWLARSILVLLLAVTLIGATINDASAGLTAEIMAATDPCCEGECPDEPVCGATCTMMARCGVQMLSPLLIPSVQAPAIETAAVLLNPDRHLPTGIAPDGLRRPPRV